MEKKVTIKYFLNDELNPVVYYDKDKNELKLYPLYIRVIYNRKTTRFKFHPNVHIERSSDIHVFFEERDIAFLLEDKERLIERLIRYESEKLKEKFTLKGLGDRLGFYEQSVSSFILKDEPELKELNRITEQSKYNTLLGVHSKDFIVKLSISALELGKEKFNETFPNLIEKFILTGYIYNSKRRVTIFDWIVKNVKNDIIHYMNSLPNKYENQPEINKEFLESKIDDKYKPLFNNIYDNTARDIFVNATKTLFSYISNDISLEQKKLIGQIDNQIKVHQKKLYH